MNVIELINIDVGILTYRLVMKYRDSRDRIGKKQVSYERPTEKGLYEVILDSGKSYFAEFDNGEPLFFVQNYRGNHVGLFNTRKYVREQLKRGHTENLNLANQRVRYRPVTNKKLGLFERISDSARMDVRDLPYLRKSMN